MRLAFLLVAAASLLGSCASVPAGPTDADREAMERMEQNGKDAQDRLDAAREKEGAAAPAVAPTP